MNSSLAEDTTPKHYQIKAGNLKGEKEKEEKEEKTSVHTVPVHLSKTKLSPETGSKLIGCGSGQ